jgi:hypothetical protein
VYDLDHIYGRLAMPRSQEDLADSYRAAARQGASSAAPSAPELARPIPLRLGDPPPATVSTAIHTLHTLPNDVEGELPGQLLQIAQRNVLDALACCHRALELDGADHDYHAEEWLPTGSLIAARYSPRTATAALVNASWPARDSRRYC